MIDHLSTFDNEMQERRWFNCSASLRVFTWDLDCESRSAELGNLFQLNNNSFAMSSCDKNFHATLLLRLRSLPFYWFKIVAFSKRFSPSFTFSSQSTYGQNYCFIASLLVRFFMFSSCSSLVNSLCYQLYTSRRTDSIEFRKKPLICHFASNNFCSGVLRLLIGRRQEKNSMRSQVTNLNQLHFDRA